MGKSAAKKDRDATEHRAHRARCREAGVCYRCPRKRAPRAERRGLCADHLREENRRVYASHKKRRQREVTEDRQRRYAETMRARDAALAPPKTESAAACMARMLAARRSR